MGNVTDTEVFFSEVFGIPRKDLLRLKCIPAKQPVTVFGFWDRITEEEFNVLFNIIKDEFELGDIKYEIFFKVLDKYRIKDRITHKMKLKEISDKKWQQSEKGKASRKASVKKYQSSEKGKATNRRLRKKYYQNNKDKIVAKKKIYYETNKVKLAEKRRNKNGRNN
tara:strand:- start:84 stop:581 length:498 start_codon:yes stop_codon:yes gene_type:complete